MIVGLSPLVRGSHRCTRAIGTRLGSIPAGAGKPQGPTGAGVPTWVYPRWCGEAKSNRLSAAPMVGLSPLVRGSPQRVPHGQSERRSIPAGAGKPSFPLARRSRARVYPRWCGEAAVVLNRGLTGSGLSPLVRGSHNGQDEFLIDYGSIPAGAGKPIRYRACRQNVWVYPRWCGEARQGNPVHRRTEGLSPLVRGSPSSQYRSGACTGSIPAGAGKPHRPCHCRGADGVYPRWCGEASFVNGDIAWHVGLSPLVRGSHPEWDHECLNDGSIPAGAGKPHSTSMLPRTPGVYPRWCGEASGQ